MLRKNIYICVSSILFFATLFIPANKKAMDLFIRFAISIVKYLRRFKIIHSDLTRRRIDVVLGWEENFSRMGSRGREAKLISIYFVLFWSGYMIVSSARNLKILRKWFRPVLPAHKLNIYF